MAYLHDSHDFSLFYDSSHDHFHLVSYSHMYDSSYDTSHDPISHCDTMATHDSISLSDHTSSSGSSDSHHLRFKLNDFYHHYWCNHRIRRKSF